MKSLYEISQEFNDLFEKIENENGEITDNVMEELSIKKEELYEKLEAYQQTIAVWNGYVDTCKSEKTRINKNENVWKNRIASLKKAIMDAVNAFGETGKSGNKRIETSTFKLFCREKSKVVNDDKRAERLAEAIDLTIKKAYKNDCLVTGGKFDPDSFLDAVNATANDLCCTENFQPFKMSDLKALEIRIDVKLSILSWMFTYGDTIKDYITLSGSECKFACSILNDPYRVDYNDTTIATVKKEQSLIIK